MVEINFLRLQVFTAKCSYVLSVSLDCDGGITSVSCSDSEFERCMLRGGNKARLQDFVKCVLTGIICSDQIEIKNNGQLDWFNIQQLA